MTDQSLASDPASGLPEKVSARLRLERSVATLGMWSYRAPLVTLLIAALIVGALATQLPKTFFLSDVDRYLPTHHPERIQFNLLREQFGREDFLLVAITPNEVFDAGFLETLRELHVRFEEELPWVDDVQSLVNARETRGAEDSLVVDDLMAIWPQTEMEIAKVGEIARANPFYRDLYLSGDGRTAGILVRPVAYPSVEIDELAGFDTIGSEDDGSESVPLSDAQLVELVLAVREIVAESRNGGLEIYVSGSPVVNYEIQSQTAADMVFFSLCSFAAIALLLLIVFRRLIAVLLPIALVATSVVATLGAMAATGRPLTFVSQIVPSFILAAGVGFAVHILAIFFQRLDGGDEQATAIEGALRHSGPAIVMSSLTTAGGMLSFVPAELIPVRDIGFFVPFGVVWAALSAITVLPAILGLVSVRAKDSGRADADGLTERALIACGLIGVRHPIKVCGISVGVLAVACLGIPKITQEYSPMEWLPEDNLGRVATNYIDQRMGGASGMELIFDSGRENGLHDPRVLEQISKIQRYAEATETAGIEITKTISVVDIVKEIHQALHDGDPGQYVVSDDRRLIAQELLLFENSGSDDLEDVVDSQFRLARISLKTPQGGAGDQVRFLAEHSQPMRDIAGESDLAITGFFRLGALVAVLISETAIVSYSLAFLFITPLMIIFIGSLRIGIVSMAPNLMPILIVMGVMGWTQMPLDLLSVLIGGIALGLVVDDTIHMLHGFRREFEELGDVEEATIRTMRTTGRALFFTTVVLTSAFMIYGFASSDTVSNFGRLTALAIALAFVFDIFLSPALLALVCRGHRRESGELGESSTHG